MRWTLIACFLMASIHNITPMTRPKRDLRAIKNLIKSKLFGTETLLVQIPKIPKNETNQLFKIKGYDNIYLKVTRKPDEPVRVVVENLNPEIAIIGNYLGTSTQKDTLLALEVTKNLLNTGILRGEHETIQQELVLPMALQNPYNGFLVRDPVNPVKVITEEIRPLFVNSPVIEAEKIVRPILSQVPHNGYVVQEHVKPVKVITEERPPIYVDLPVIEAGVNVVDHRPAAVHPVAHPPMIVATEVKYNPIQKYSYQQETEDGYTTYYSYNNHEVAVIRTKEAPVIPRYIGLRLAEIISIAANPHLIQTRPPFTSAVEYGEYQPLNAVPIHSYVSNKSPHSTATKEESGYVPTNNLNHHPPALHTNPPKVSESLHKPNLITESNPSFDIRNHLTDGEIDKINKCINQNLEQCNNNDNLFISKPYDADHNSEEGKNNIQKLIDSSQLSNGQFVTRYSYKQLGDEVYGNTVVRIEDPKQISILNQSEFNVVNSEVVPQNYIFIPPESDVPPPPISNNVNAKIPRLKANKDEQSKYNNNEEYSYNNAEKRPETSVPMSLRGDLGQSELFEKLGQLKTNGVFSLTQNPIIVPEVDKEGDQTNSIRPYIGGQASDSNSASNSVNAYIGRYGATKS